MATVNSQLSFGVQVSEPIQAGIEALIAEVESELEAIPVDRRGEFLDEMRAHLYSMLSARISDGQSEQAAWKSTQLAFGDGAEIGRELADEWTRKPRIEFQGAPMTRREKLILVGKTLATSAVLFPSIFFGLPVLRSHGLDGFFFVIVVCLSGAYRWYQSHRNPASYSAPWTLTKKLALGLAIGHITMTWLFMQFASSGSGTLFSRIYSLWNLLFSVGCIVFVLRARREYNTTRPWQALPRYKSSPVAAEQEFRLSPTIGFFTSLTCVGLMACIAGAQSLGIWAVVGAAFALLAFAVFVVRALR